MPLLFAACGVSSDSTTDGLEGDCNNDCTEQDDDDNTDSDCTDDSCNGGADTDVDVDTSLSADLSINVAGSGIYIGLDPLCSLDVAGQFYAAASGKASFDGETWLIVDVSAAASIETGDGCSCSAVSVEAMASVSIDVELAADAASCKQACADADPCESSCNQDGNKIVGHASVNLDASASISVTTDDSDLDALVGASLSVELDAVVDSSGRTVKEL